MVTQKDCGKRLAGVPETSIGLWALFSVVIYLFNREAFTSVAVAFLLATFYYLFASQKDSANNLFHPYSFFVLAGGILPFGLPAVLVAVTQNALMKRGRGLDIEHMAIEHLGVVSFMVAAFFIMYVAGYKLSAGKKLARSIPLFGFSKRRPRRQYIFTAILLYGVGWLARIMAFGQGAHHMNPDLGGALTLVSSVLTPLSIFCTLSFVVLIWEKFSYAKTNVVARLFSPLVIVLIGLEVLAGIIDGSKSRMILPLVYVAFAYNYTFSRLKWRHAILGILMVIVVLAPAAMLFSMKYKDVLGESGASIEGARTSIELLGESRADGQFENLVVLVIARMSSALYGAITVYDNVPSQVDYAGGETFFPSALLNFVPRPLWADKPVYRPGREFAQTFWNKGVGEEYATNMEINMVGEAYYNFGWFGLFIAIPLGVILRFFTERVAIYSRIEKNSAPRIYFALFIVSAIGVFHYYPANLLRGALFCLLFLSILNRALPSVLRLRSRHAPDRRLADSPETPQ